MCVACPGSSSKMTSQSTTSFTEDRETLDLVYGRILPKNSTNVRAPRDEFRLRGSISSSDWAKLVFIKPDGATVKQGEKVAQFQFRYADALDRVQLQIDTAEASRKKSGIDMERVLEELLNEERNRAIDAERAKIDTRKADAISKRQLALLEIDAATAEFEAGAVRERVAAHRASMSAEEAFYREESARSQFELTRYHRQKANYELIAPHDGILRHGYHPHHRRKIQKGDGMPSGLAVISIARDEQISVQTFVPEHLISSLRVGATLFVRGLNGDEEFPATVQRIERFPQEIGFLREDDALPNAREKAFVVWADFGNGKHPFTSGNEVRVRLTEEEPTQDTAAIALPSRQVSRR